MSDCLTVRPAVLSDTDAIFNLLEIYAPGGTVLRRSKEDIAFYIGNFSVAEYAGKVCACAALRDFGSDLLELRSVVVAPELQGKGIGKTIVESVIADLRMKRQHFRLFTLTTTPAFFQTMGFVVSAKEEFPEKIWSDCSKCAKFSCCDETALIITQGEFA